MNHYSKKSQASIEFLSTYSWVIIILLATLGILINYGFLNPSKYLPEKVEFGDQLVVEEYFLDANMDDSLNPKIPVVSLKIRNNFPRPIELEEVYVNLDNNNGFEECNITPTQIDIGETGIFGCVLQSDLNINTKNKLNIALEFERVGSTHMHNITGIIFGEPTEGEYCGTYNPDNPSSYIFCDDNSAKTNTICTTLTTPQHICPAP